MNYKGKIFMLIVFILYGCSKPQTDKALLELDQKQLAENLDYEKITFYKFAKIAIRSAAVQDTTKAEYQKFSKNLNNITNSLTKIDTANISALDAILLYKDYRAVQGFVKETDEDIFPTLVEGINGLNNNGEKFQLLSALKKQRLKILNMLY